MTEPPERPQPEPPPVPPQIQIHFKDGSVTDFAEVRAAYIWGDWFTIETPIRERWVWNRDVIYKIQLTRDAPLQGPRSK